MIWTALRVTPSGVVLHDEHERRLAPAGPAFLRAFRKFAATATPGSWIVRADGDALQSERFTSSLSDDSPTRTLVSPYAELTGSFSKPSRPSAYHDLRQPGVVTLLTSGNGAELYETCAAALVGWDGSRLVLVPDRTPRVDSTSERFLRRNFDCVRAPLVAADSGPILAVNAVKGTCSLATSRRPFPDVVRRRIDDAFEQSARR